MRPRGLGSETPSRSLRFAKPNTKAQALARTPLFAGLSEGGLLERLSQATEDIDMEAGRVLCREGERPRQFFVIREGEVELTKAGEHVRRLAPGDFFGSVGLIEQAPCRTTATAVTSVRLFVLSGRAFWQLMKSNEEVERRVLRELVIANAAERTVAERLLTRQLELNEYQALHDPLTGLPNRALFSSRIEQALSDARREETQFALLMLDLDQFKNVNDVLGHHSGDVLLKEIGRRLMAKLRSIDTVARLGGDEFGILLYGCGRSDIEPVIEAIRTEIERPIVVDDLPIAVEASIGVTLFPTHGDDSDALLQRADIALYVAKYERSTFAFYEPPADESRRMRLTVVGELRRAIDANELVLHYQPKATLSTGEIVAVEALVRWLHPELGLVGPQAFIPAAEQTSLIKPLTHYVLEHALAQSVAWRKAGIHLAVAVNLSMRNLFDVSLPDEIDQLLRRFHVNPNLLELEMTESTMLGEASRTGEVLRRLSELGIRLSVDDFGTGYSSLSHLKRLPVDELKIDRSFVMNMTSNENDAAIVRSTIDLAHNLGLRVVAEGVEDGQTWNRLNSLGCDFAQGYFLSRPKAADELATWLRQRGAARTGTRSVRGLRKTA